MPLAGAALVAALIAAAPAQACDVRKTARVQKPASGTPRPPLIVGDSTMLLATPYLGARGIEADARGCRQLPKGVDLLASRRHAGRLPRVAVLALGANGSIGDGQIRRALRIVGPARVLGLVTPTHPGSGSADAMRRAAARHPDRVLLIDWARHSRGHGRWFAGDGLHVGYEGARAFADLVRRRLDPFFPPRALRVPDAPSAGAKPCGTVLRRGAGLEVLVVRGAARVTCARARGLVRSRSLGGIDGWRYYDWRRAGRRTWTAVLVRRDRRIVVVARPPVRAPAPG